MNYNIAHIKIIQNKKLPSWKVNLSWTPNPFPSIIMVFYSMWQPTSQYTGFIWCSLPLTLFLVQSGICLPNTTDTSFIRVTNDITLPHPVVSSQSSSWPSFISDRWPLFLLSHFPHFAPHIMVFLPFQAILLLRILSWILLIFPT